MTRIRPLRVNHLNLVVEDHHAAVAHLEGLWGARHLVELPQDDWRACLVDIGHVIFELFAPNNFFLSTRYGPHHLGVEYQADVGIVRAAFAERGIRVARDLGVAVHAHPADCFGIAFEFWDGQFHDNERVTGGPMVPASFWRDEHPLGLVGLAGYVVLTDDLETARAFLVDLFECEVLYDEERPAVGGRAVGLGIADAALELLGATGEGSVRRQLIRSGPGIWSTVFRVADRDAATAYFRERGVELQEGTADGRLAVPAPGNLGITFELMA